MTTTTEHALTVPMGWLRSPAFDLVFVLGVATLAIASGTLVVAQPDLFLPVLAANLWLLGYHHVISTYTRLCFDRQSLREHRFLLFGLPLIVLAAVVALSATFGLWILATIYLYWQWFHYTRQSFGVAQVYRRKAGGLLVEDERVAKLTFYLLPLWGILYRSHQDPGSFLGLELRVLPIPEWIITLVGMAAMVSVIWWAGQRLQAWWRGQLAVAHTLYMLSHFAVFAVGYVVIESLDAGWLVLNIWHNAQYILFVWLYNNGRFRGGVEPQARLLSTMSQSRNFWLYGVICLGLSTTVYLALTGVFVGLLAAVIPAIVIFQTINFHHYVVDGLIWKVRRKPLQQTLGLTQGAR